MFPREEEEVWGNGNTLRAAGICVLSDRRPRKPPLPSPRRGSEPSLCTPKQSSGAPTTHTTVQPNLYVCVCVCVCECERMYVPGCVGMYQDVCVCVCVCLCARVRVHVWDLNAAFHGKLSKGSS